MKKQRPLISILKYCALFAALASGRALHAQTTYQWNNTAGGSWANTANWNGGIVASGAGNTADFSELTLTAGPTVTLDGAQTIGNLLFGDQGNTYGWTLSTGSAGPLTLAVSSGAPTVTVNGQTTTVGCVLAGTQGLTLAGAGTLTLSAANTYTGNTIINGGTLNGVAGAFGFGNISLNANSTTLGINSGTVTNTLNAASGVTGTLNLANGLSFAGLFSGSGTINIPSGSYSYTRTFTSVGNSGFSGALVSIRGANVFSGANANFSSANFEIIPSVLTDTSTYLEFTGAGTTVINSVSAASGGQLEIGPSTILNVVSGTINQGTTSSQNTIIEPSSGTTSTLTSSGGTFTFGGISGTIVANPGVTLADYGVGSPLAVVQNGTETVAFENANSYSGGTTINSGILSLGNGGNEVATALGTGTVTINGGALKFAPSSSTIVYSITNAVVLNGGALWGVDGYQHITGPISVTSNGGTLESQWNNKYLWVFGPITGSGPLTLAYAGGGNTPVQINLTNNLGGYTGLLTVGTSAELVMDANMTLNGLAGAGNVVNSGYGLALNNSVTANLSGVISGTGSVTNTGTGQTLSGVNTYSGATLVNAGILTLADSGDGSGGTIGSSPITVMNGGELDLNNADVLGYSSSQPMTVYGVVKKIYNQAETLNRPITLSNGVLTNTLTSSQNAYEIYGNYIATAANTTNWITGPGNFGLRTSTAYITNAPGSVLNISATVYPYTSGCPLNKNGAGTLVLLATNSFNGSLVVNAGLVEVLGANTNATGGATVSGGTLDGTGMIGGTVVVNSGILSAGLPASLGTLTLSNALTVNAGGVILLRISKTGGLIANDSLNGMASAAYGGTLIVTNVTTDSTALAAGDTFALFNSAAYSGGFATYTLPALATGLSWDKSQLAVSGTIRVIAGTGTPVFNPVAGNYVGAQSVTISSDAGSKIFYTTDGSNPTTSGTRISGLSPISGIIIPVNTTETLNAYATNSGTTPSAVASATYTTINSGIWTNVAGGSWPVSGNWYLGAVPSGSGLTADLSQLTLTNKTTVSVSGAETIGTLLFEDQGNAYGWVLNGSGPLTMNAVATVPSLVISNQFVSISTPIAGTNGLAVSGTGAGTSALALTSSANSFSGNLTLSGVSVTNNSQAGSTTFDLGAKVSGRSLTISNNAMLTFTINNVFGGGGMNATNLPTLVVNGLMFSSQYNAMPSIVLNGGTLDQNVAASGSYQGYQFLGGITVGGTSASTISADNGGADQLLGGGTTFNVALTGASGPDLTVSCPLMNASPDYGSSAGILIKTGAGTMQLSGASTYTGATVVSNGLLQITGSIANSAVTVSGGTVEVDGTTGTGAVTVNGGTLDGTGAVGGPVTVNTGGTLSAATAAGMGTLSINSTLTMSGGTNLMRISKTGGSLASDSLSGLTSVAFGGTLTVNNVTSDGTQLAAGDTFYLYSASAHSGAFVHLILPTLASGLSWDLSGLTTSGSIAVSADAPTPVFNPVAGGYVGALPVTITSEAGATIYYTTDGSDPASSGTVLSGSSPVTVTVPVNTASMTITAYATQSGLGDSSEASATYATVATPTWINTSSDSWSGSYNWSNAVVADAIGETADFSTLTLTADTSVTLDIGATVGSLVFADQGDSFNWILVDGGAGPLTLNNGTNMPVITVVNTNTTITAALAGTGGFIKAGTGTLTLSTNNSTYTGGTVINGGRLLATAGGWYTARSISTGMLTVNTNGTAEFTLAHGFGGDNYGRAVTINGGTLQFDAENYVSGLTLSGGSIAGTGEFRSVAATYVVNPSAIPSVISVPVSLYSSCTFDVGSGASLLISGNVYNSGGLTKTDSGALVLTGTNTYTGGTTVSNGTLEVDGSLGIGGVTVAGGTLDGSGNIGSSVTVNSGATLGCGSANIGELTISGPLLLSGTTTVRLNKTGSVLTNDSVQGLSSVTYGGTLTVTATGTALAAGDTFTLFGSSSYSSSFSATNLPALASGLAWITTNLTVNGSIQVVATVNTTPGDITASISGNLLSLSWPADHTGWRLLVQTNNLGAGLSSNPSDWTTVAGSAGIYQTNIPINPTQPAAFYRLVYP